MASVKRAESPKDMYRYYFKVGGEIVCFGITNDLERREKEHRLEWPTGRIIQLGPLVTKEKAFRWERDRFQSERKLIRG